MSRSKGRARQASHQGSGIAHDRAVGAKAAIPRPGPSRSKIWGFRFGLAVLAPVLATLLAEGVLRCVGFGYSTSFFVRSKSGTNYITNEKFACQFFSGKRNLRPFVSELPAVKAPGTVRICILGESAAMGTPDPAFGFARILEILLRDQFPERRFEIINAAMRGINSHIIREITCSCARHEVDAFVAYMGNNEVIGFHGADPDTPAWRLSLPLIRASLWGRSTRVGQAVSACSERFAKASQAGENQDMPFFRKHCVPADDWRREKVRENFRANLEDICRLTRRAGARAILCTVAVNQHDFPPLASRHRGGLASVDQARWEAACQSGIESAEKGEHRRALEHFRIAEGIDDHFAELHFRMGRSFLAVDEVAQARQHYRQALDWDALQFRTDSGLNGIVRSVAAAGGPEQVALVDADQIFAASELSERGIPGARLFHDHVHPTFSGNYLLARSCAARLAEILGAAWGTRRKEQPLSESECASQVPFTSFDDINVRGAQARLTSLPPFLDQLDYAQRQAAAELDVKTRMAAFTPVVAAECIRIFTNVIRREPNWWPARFNLGNLYEELGQATLAVEQYRSVSAQFPDVKKFKLTLASALLKAKDKPGALAQVEAALQIDPQDVDARRMMRQLGAQP